MNLTERSLANPAAAAVVAAIVLLLGLVTLSRLPIQLFPDIDQPEISIQTSWRAASPREVEAELVEPLEEVLRGTPGVEVMRAFANRGGAFINLTFGIETDMNAAMLEVISRLNRLPPMPADSDPPRITLGGFNGGAQKSLIWFFIQALPGAEKPIEEYRQFIQDTVAPRIEAIEGVAGVNVSSLSGGEQQLSIRFDPYRAASLGIDITNIASQVGRATDVSGGFVDVGRRQYTLRFEGRYSPAQLGALILDWRDGSPITLGDIATIAVDNGRSQGITIQNGNPAIAFQVLKGTGANVLETLEKVKAEVELINDEVLARVGLNMQKSFDPSVFINRAIRLVTNNLLVGVMLAIGVLWWFLRQGRATALIALTIPVSLLATFIVLGLAGRTVNIISLAGLAFATGMVLDAAIVVLENIVRLREKGVPAHEASLQGATQVWGALIASTATTVAIFIPVIFIKDAEGQLFGDLALTIAIGVSVSLIVAVTILPAAAKILLKTLPPSDAHQRRWSTMADGIMRFTGTGRRRASWILGLMGTSLLATWLLVPSLNYLPPVKRDAVDAFLNFPAGSNITTMREEVADVIVERLAPYMSGEKEPALLNYYLITFPGGGGAAMGVRARDQGQVKELERLIRDEILADFPDVRVFAQQGNLFGGFGSSGSIAIHLQSVDGEALKEAAITGMQLLEQAFEGGNTNPNPDPMVAAPELRLIPNDRRIAEVGWTRTQVATAARALGDGLWLGEHFDGEKRLDIIFQAESWDDPEALASIPVSTPRGGVVLLGELVEIRRGVGPAQIQRVDGRRTVTLNFNPPEGMPLEDAMNIIRSDVEPGLRAALPVDGSIIYGGSADGLKRAVTTLGTNFVLALFLLFLIMAALFKSPKDALLVVISIPLATVGGIAAIRLLNLVTFQPLDLLTMIGFIILLGLVVNNAILLVVQTRRSEAEGASRTEAVREALRLRLRPIFMSTLTSIFGMLPMLVFPGEGSAIYRGMAAAIVGGMSVSTVFTLILLPSLLQLDFGDFLRQLRGGGAALVSQPRQTSAAE
ncbi:MAG: efflux RND transporter permease subunit [Proteobacteria bacterium]|nr:efflux RND transporter permease subunit [Pseudomonadota bacterium]